MFQFVFKMQLFGLSHSPTSGEDMHKVHAHMKCEYDMKHTFHISISLK